jgi:hypothetical protein
VPTKPKVKAVYDPTKCWLCEECGTAHDELVNPPDSCSWCGYRYFANLKDEMDGDWAASCGIAPRTA